MNVGSHYLQFEPNFAITYMPNHGKTEFSSRVHYAINTTNPDNNYHSGSYISWEFNATQNVTKTTALGFQGYLAKQVRDDTISGVRTGDGNRTQALGLGPEIRVAIPRGLSPSSISVRQTCAITQSAMDSGLNLGCRLTDTRTRARPLFTFFSLGPRTFEFGLPIYQGTR